MSQLTGNESFLRTLQKCIYTNNLLFLNIFNIHGNNMSIFTVQHKSGVSVLDIISQNPDKFASFLKDLSLVDSDKTAEIKDRLLVDASTYGKKDVVTLLLQEGADPCNITAAKCSLIEAATKHFSLKAGKTNYVKILKKLSNAAVNTEQLKAVLELVKSTDQHDIAYAIGRQIIRAGYEFMSTERTEIAIDFLKVACKGGSKKASAYNMLGVYHEQNKHPGNEHVQLYQTAAGMGHSQAKYNLSRVQKIENRASVKKIMSEAQRLKFTSNSLCLFSVKLSKEQEIKVNQKLTEVQMGKLQS